MEYFRVDRTTHGWEESGIFLLHDEKRKKYENKRFQMHRENLFALKNLLLGSVLQQVRRVCNAMRRQRNK